MSTSKKPSSGASGSPSNPGELVARLAGIHSVAGTKPGFLAVLDRAVAIRRRFMARAYSVRTRLRSRLSDMFTSDDGDGSEPVRLVRSSSCRPCGIALEQSKIRCGLPLACPFCWGRNAQITFNNHILAGIRALDTAVRSRSVMMCSRRCYQFDAADDYMPTLIRYVRCAAASRRIELSALGGQVLGAHTGSCFAPASGRDIWYEWRFCVLVADRKLLTPGYCESLKDEGYHVRRLSLRTVDEMALAAAVGRAVAFPRSLLWADPLRIDRLLRAIGGSHLRSSTGCFRAGFNKAAGGGRSSYRTRQKKKDRKAVADAYEPAPYLPLLD